MDKLDHRILQAIQDNARISNVDLARELGVAPSTMLERMRKLEKNGVLKGFRAILDPESLGYTIQAFVSVTLDRHDHKLIESFERDVQTIAHVRSCYHLTGRFDYLLAVVARDLTHLGKLVKERIASIPGIGTAETFLVLSNVKEENGWPLAGLIDPTGHDSTSSTPPEKGEAR